MATGKPPSRAASWRHVAERSAKTLGSPWMLAGRGVKSRLVITPVRWWLSSCGFNPSRDGVTGDLFGTQQPLTVPWTPRITLSQSGYDEDDKPRDRFDPAAADADPVLTWWCTGPAARLFASHSEDDLVERMERDFAARDEVRPNRWPALAGFRLIRGSGPPEPVIDAVLDLISAGDYLDEEGDWWQEFRSVVGHGSRRTSLTWLDSRRRATLTNQLHIATSAVADVATTEAI